MKLYDAINMGLYNLKRAILRTILTTLGVVVGIATLSSMISFGAGMEKNVLESFKKNDLFTSMVVSSKKIDIEAAMEGDVSSLKDTSEKFTVLNDSSLKLIQNLPEVEIAFPEISLPVRLKFRDVDVRTNVAALPYKMGELPPFNTIAYGKFLSSDSCSDMVVSNRMLKRLKIIIKEKDTKELTKKEIENGYKLLPIDSIIGKEIYLYTATMKSGFLVGAAATVMFGGEKAMGNIADNAFENKESKFRIVGIFKKDNQFSSSFINNDAIIAPKTASALPTLGFDNVWEILGNNSANKSKYNNFQIKIKDAKMVDAAKAKLEKMNFSVVSFVNQLDEIRKVFFVMDAILGAIGIVSLFVAALGIINTMVMSILERTKEIGIMKAIGGSESDIRRIFFIEASLIGFLGGVIGLLLGWSVTLAASFIINSYVLPSGVPEANIFYFPLWLIFGALGFSIVISLFAGLYPAYRAARVDPVIALRHE